MNKTCMSLALAAALALGCGGDDEGPTGPQAPTAAEFAGTWIIQSLTYRGETLTRDGNPVAIRGDVVITPTGTATADYYYREMELSDGLLESGPNDDAGRITVEAGKWLFDDPDSNSPDEVFVFRVTRVGEAVTLTVDPTDPRHDEDDEMPTEMVFERATPWGTQCVGAWELVSIDLPDVGTLTPTTCFEPSPGIWGTYSSNADISDHLLYEQNNLFTLYDDMTCTTGATPFPSRVYGMVEEEGSTYRLWSENEDLENEDTGEPKYGEYTIAVDGSGQMTLTRVACLPAGCEDAAPTELVLRPR